MTESRAQKNIPLGWKLKKLSDVLDYERPDNYIVKSTSYSDKAKIPVLTANKSFILGHTDEDFGIYKDIPAIIFDDFTTDSKFVDFPFKVKSSAIKILKEKNKDVDLKFFYEKMKSINFPTGSHKRFYISQYQDMEVLVPPYPEQRKIAEILEMVDGSIAATQEVIEATEKLKRGLMRQLFARRSDWKALFVKELARVKGGKRLPKGANFIEEKTEHPYIRVTDFSRGTVDVSNLKYISKDLYEKIKRYIINKEDIFISIAGSIGFVGIIPNELDGANLTENAAKIVLNQKNVIQRYLYYFLISQYAQNYFNKVISKSGQPKLALFKIEELEVPVPPINEQKKIAEILSVVDKKILINEGLKEKLALLKKGLMRDLLSGKVRITNK